MSDSEKRTVQGGCLIVMEGIDGSGKTTQCDLLVKWLEDAGYEVVRTREPTDGPFGRKIRQHAVSGDERLSLEDELDLFIQDRREHVEQLVKPALARGAVVVMDRYYFSTMAYQGARGADPEAIRRSNEAFAPIPDILLYLRLEVDRAGDRIEQGRGGRDLFETASYQRRVAEQFDALQDKQLARIDASQAPEAVFEEIRHVVESRLAERA